MDALLHHVPYTTETPTQFAASNHVFGPRFHFKYIALNTNIWSPVK